MRGLKANLQAIGGTMYFVWIGVLAVALKYFEVGPFATISWLWVLAPLGLAFLWFEVFETFFKKHKKPDDGKIEAERKARVAAGFAKDPRAVKR
jgi:small Trp-rich protein